MASSHPSRNPNSNHKILSSCALASLSLILLSISISIALFILFRPRSPTIHVSAVQIPAFSSANATLTFTFAQYALVRNPNRAAFSHYDSSLQLIYAGNQIGFIYIPAGEIGGGGAKSMGGRFSVGFFFGGGEMKMAGVVKVESRMRVKGRVRVLRFFTHRVEAIKGCLVAVSPGDGSVMGIRC